MLKRLNATYVVLLIAAAIVIACAGDQALLVSPRIDGAPPLGVVNDPKGTAVRPVNRQIALSEDATWSFDVGPSGITKRYPSAGLSITVPPGAVTETTHITVIALRGAAVAYRFEPHGLQFAQPLTLSQSLRGLRIGRNSLGMPRLIAGYFAEDLLSTDAATGNARVREILPVQIDVTGHNAVLQIYHFSGYTVASAMGIVPDSVSFDLR